MTKRVLIVEDEALVALAIEDVLLEAGYQVCGIADTAREALDLARRHAPDLAVIDVRLARRDDGIARAHALAALGPIRMLFATGNPEEVRQRARAGQGCLSKPFEAGWLLEALVAVRADAAAVAALAIPGFFALPFRPAP